MCKIEDYEHLKLGGYRMILENELAAWHHWYLPVPNGTVFDIGAGAGETAQFFLLHGAKKVVAVECDLEALRLLNENFGKDPRVVIVPERADKIKIDIEGSERNMSVETHFPYKWRVAPMKYSTFYRYVRNLRLEEDWGGLLTKAARKILRRVC